MLRSMTAFISDVFSLSETSKYPSADITYEIKGLNNKFLDISFKSNFNLFLFLIFLADEFKYFFGIFLLSSTL